MKPAQPIYLRDGGCRVLLCGYNIYAGVRLSRFSTCTKNCLHTWFVWCIITKKGNDPAKRGLLPRNKAPRSITCRQGTMTG